MALLSSLQDQPRATIRCAWIILSCLYIAYMMGWSYYMACMEPPGSALNGLSENLGERRKGPGSGIWWQQCRERVANATFESQTERSRETDSPLPFAHSSACLSSSSKTPSTPNAKGVPQNDSDLNVGFRFCKKCPQVTLTEALLRLPPELRHVEKVNRRNHLLKLKQQAAEKHGLSSESDINDMTSNLPPELWLENDDEGEAEVREWLGDDAQNLVLPPKPERAHHCKACKMCVLKYDHHCPWINQCVGLGNERYFILFMLWFSFGSSVLSITGWDMVNEALWQNKWPFRYVPRVLFIMIYAKAFVMGIVVFILGLWHLYLVSRGETSVENQDNSHYRKMAKKRNDCFVNVYDLGYLRNLQIFFNVGPGLKYGYYTLLLPLRIEPYSDGWHWAKSAGLAGRHLGIEKEEEFTDDEGIEQI